MIVGGYPSPAYNDVELIDLSGQKRTCAKPNDVPSIFYGSVGTYIDAIQTAKVCGGYVQAGVTDNCYNYVPESREWLPAEPMIEERTYATAGYIDGQWWVTGGRTASNYQYNSTEIFDINNSTFVPYTNLPEPRYEHNIVSLTNNSVMFLGGEEYYNTTFIYDSISGSWTDGPTLLKLRQDYPAGRFQYPNGTYAVIVAGGYNDYSSEILFEGQSTWISGPDLPANNYSTRWSAVVPWKDTFILAGGESDEFGVGYHDTLLMYSPEPPYWILLNETMTTARSLFSAFMVPDEFCQTF